MVGCVVVKDQRVIGEGFHRRFGSPHAEPTALAAASECPAGSTVYVTLEPCCHTNKKTPPCTDALIQARVGKVVAACLDPNPCVSGKGMATLQAARIQTRVGLLENDARQLNAPFFAATIHHRPYITLKWAQTADNKVAGPAGARLRITSPPANRLVHQLRGRSDAILIGINTALADDPLLTARDVDVARPLIRVVLDSHLRLPPASRLVRSANNHRLLVYCSAQCPLDRIAALESRHVTVMPAPTDTLGHLLLPPILNDLYLRNVTHLLVEPGPALARTLISQNLADRLWLFRSPTMIEAVDAPEAIPVPPQFVRTATIPVAPDSLTEYLNAQSTVYFSATPSADVQLIA